MLLALVVRFADVMIRCGAFQRRQNATIESRPVPMSVLAISTAMVSKWGVIFAKKAIAIVLPDQAAVLGEDRCNFGDINGDDDIARIIQKQAPISCLPT